MSHNHLIQRAVVGIALVLFVGGGFATATSYWVQKFDYAVIIDEQKISQVEYQRRLVETRQMFRGNPLPESVIQQAAINQLIERGLMLREAEKRQLKVTENEIEQDWQHLLNDTYGGQSERMRQDLYRSYYTEADFHQELAQRQLMHKLEAVLEADVKVPETKLKEFYDQHQEQFRYPERIEARHILFKADKTKPAEVQKAKAQAEDLIHQLQSGANFVELAKKYSQDESSKINGGSLGAFGKGEMEPAFEAAAWQLKPDEYSLTPVQTSFGWHVIQRGKTLPGGIKTFAEVKLELTAQLLEPQKREFMQQWLKQQRQMSKIEINSGLIKPLSSSVPGSPKQATDPVASQKPGSAPKPKS